MPVPIPPGDEYSVTTAKCVFRHNNEMFGYFISLIWISYDEHYCAIESALINVNTKMFQMLQCSIRGYFANVVHML